MRSRTAAGSAGVAGALILVAAVALGAGGGGVGTERRPVEVVAPDLPRPAMTAEEAVAISPAGGIVSKRIEQTPPSATVAAAVASARRPESGLGIAAGVESGRGGGTGLVERVARAEAPEAVPTAPAVAAETTTTIGGGLAAAAELSPREVLMLGAINAARAEAGVGAMRLRDDLTSVARERSEEMTRLGYFAHFHPEGHSAYALLAAAGVTFAVAGENLVKTYGEVERSVELGFTALMNSPAHRDNLLNPAYTWIGVGSSTGDDGVTIITTIFTDR